MVPAPLHRSTDGRLDSKTQMGRRECSREDSYTSDALTAGRLGGAVSLILTGAQKKVSKEENMMLEQRRTTREAQIQSQSNRGTDADAETRRALDSLLSALRDSCQATLKRRIAPPPRSCMERGRLDSIHAAIHGSIPSCFSTFHGVELDERERERRGPGSVRSFRSCCQAGIQKDARRNNWQHWTGKTHTRPPQPPRSQHFHLASPGSHVVLSLVNEKRERERGEHARYIAEPYTQRARVRAQRVSCPPPPPPPPPSSAEQQTAHESPTLASYRIHPNTRDFGPGSAPQFGRIG